MIDWWGPVIHESYASSETGFITLCTSQDALSQPGTPAVCCPARRRASLTTMGVQCRPASRG